MRPTRLLTALLALVAAFAVALGFTPSATAAPSPSAPSATFYVNNPDGLLHASLATAAAAWSKGTNIDVVVGVGDPAHTITVYVRDELSGYASGGFTAGYAHDGIIEVNALTYEWYGLDAEQFTVVHELGHIIGLPHITTDPRSVMTPVWPPGKFPRGPDANDRALVNARYPV